MIVGIDFGTSNSACFVRKQNGESAPVILEYGSQHPQLLPSCWYFSEDSDEGLIGEAAQQAYIEHGYHGRFIRSLKTNLSNLSLKTVSINGKNVYMEELVAMILRRIKTSIEEEHGAIEQVVAGRPVIFSQDRNIDAAVEHRLRMAYKMAGLPEPSFMPEPVAAAYYYKSEITTPQIVFVADFGGGTLDFCLMELQPKNSKQPDSLIRTSGIRIGGDDMTSGLISLFWEDLGYNTLINNMTRTQKIPMPKNVYAKLAEWKNFWKLADLRTDVDSILQCGCEEKEKVLLLRQLMEDKIYFDFLTNIEKMKIKLSAKDQVPFHFAKEGVRLDKDISVEKFNLVIAKQRIAIEEACLQTFLHQDISPEKVDAVFLTGGSAQLTFFKNMINKIFGPEKIRSGNFFTSVAQGLSQC